MNANILIDMMNGEKLEKIDLTKRITIDGRQETYDVYKIPLDYLYYNDQNGRINTAYHQFVSKNGKLSPVPGESKYNKQFEQFIFESDSSALKKTQLSIEKNGQQEPGVVLPDGRVIDGNRRLTAVRRIGRSSGITQFFEAAILHLDIESKIDEKKIKQLELDLQLGREEKKSYDPIDRIFDVYNTVKIQKLLTVDEYKVASDAGNTKGINRDLRLADLIIKFLKIVSPGGDVNNKFYLARDLKLDGPIEEIEGTLSKLKRKKNEITDIVLTTMAVQTTLADKNNKKDTTRRIRAIKNDILNKPEIKKHYIDATDPNAELIMDYFEENPIQSAQDLKVGLESSPELVKASSGLIQSTNRLSLKGQKDADRRQSLIALEDIRDNLEEISSSDLKYLKEEEYQDAKEVLSQIRDLAYKIEHGDK